MRILVQPRGFDQFLDLSSKHELLELGFEQRCLPHSQVEAAVFVYNHPYGKDGEQREANHHRASK
jgi:hypothetical protein